MLNRLRFQEIEKVIFKVREDAVYGGVKYCKGEPFLIMDNASLSNFTIHERNKIVTGRSTEADTATIKNVSFYLSNGQVALNLFNSIFGKEKYSQPTTYTVNDTLYVENDNRILLPSTPVGDVILYLTDDYGNLTKIAKDQYTVNDDVIEFIKPINCLITYTYMTSLMTKRTTEINQLGKNLILSLEMQCEALDILTEEKISILMKFDKVSVGTNLSLSFNNSEKGSESMIYVQGIPEDNQNQFNKAIFTIEVI